MRRSLVICSLLFVISSASNALAQTLPKATGRVNDFANVIDPAVEAEIDRRLDLLEQKTSSEIAVATIKSLDGMSSSDYANRLFKEWGVGQAKTDNGVLVVIAIDDRDMAIEVGYGLEGVLPDGLAGQIIRDDFTPRFRDGDYSGGIRNGVMRLADVVEKQQVLTPEELAQFNAGSASPTLSRLYRRAVLRPVRGDWVRAAWRRPAQQDGVPAVVRQPVRRHAAADESGVTRQAVADDAVSVCARDAGRRLSPRRQAGVARRVPQHRHRAAGAAPRRAAGRWAVDRRGPDPHRARHRAAAALVADRPAAAGHRASGRCCGC